MLKAHRVELLGDYRTWRRWVEEVGAETLMPLGMCPGRRRQVSDLIFFFLAGRKHLFAINSYDNVLLHHRLPKVEANQHRSRPP